MNDNFSCRKTASEDGIRKMSFANTVFCSDWETADNCMWNSLYSAVINGDRIQVEQILQLGTDLIKEKGCNLLLYAARKKQWDVALYLLKAGAGWNAYCFYRNTALHYAALHGHKELVEALIRAGAPVDLKNVMRRTPLYLALERRHLEVATYLLKSGANANVGIRNLYTALQFQIIYNQKELIEAGYDAVYFTGARSFTKMKEFHRNSVFQLDAMECTILGNSGITLFKFLLEQDEDKLVKHLFRDGLVEDLEKAISDESSFNIYKDMIERQFLKGRERKCLLQSIEFLVPKSRLQVLPFEMWAMVFKHLSNFDLLNFKESLDIFENEKNEIRSGKWSKSLKRTKKIAKNVYNFICCSGSSGIALL